MKFDVYGRFTLEIVRERDAWAAYRLAPGRRVPDRDVVLPSDLDAAEVATFLDDLFHELAGPGQRVVRVD
jgi:hypothetical protein